LSLIILAMESDVKPNNLCDK